MLVSSNRYPYQPLPKDDSTRFVEIEAAQNENDPVICKLVTIPFGKKPKFEALSYMWGDKNKTTPITVDGVEVPVTVNLRDALQQLRIRPKPMQLWVDALSINQDDKEELNKQVANMRHIYSRAQRVVVWLGSKYLAFQDTIQNVLDSVPGDEVRRRQAIDAAEEKMTRALVEDEYWTRLWIIQEVSLPYQKCVSFGRCHMAWDDFISSIKGRGAFEACGPLRLAGHIQKKYCGGHTLRNLLLTHRDAQCTEPRDTVYGLVGLASDASEFPIDYNKSLMEVWTDTMKFMNARNMFKRSNESEYMNIGRLLKHRLMGDKVTPLQRLIRPYKDLIHETIMVEGEEYGIRSPNSFEMDVYIAGCIGWVGPSTQEICSILAKADEWLAQLHARYGDTPPSAAEESDRLLRAIFDTEDDDDLAKLCNGYVSLVKWEKLHPHLPRKKVRLHKHGKGGLYWQEKVLNCRQPRKLEEDEQEEEGQGTRKKTNDLSTIAATAPTRINLYQRHRAHLYQLCPGTRAIPYRMGIITANARLGDLVCWIRETRQAFVVRVEFPEPIQVPLRATTYQVVGTALSTVDIAPLGDDLPFSARLDAFDMEDTMRIRVDAMSLFHVL